MKKAMVSLMVVMVSVLVVAAGEGWLPSVYRSTPIVNTPTVSLAYTNVSKNIEGIGSVLVHCGNATGTWTIAVANNSYTAVPVKAAALTPAAPDLVWEANGLVPLAPSGVLTFTGTCFTNTAAYTNTVQFQVHLLNK